MDQELEQKFEELFERIDELSEQIGVFKEAQDELIVKIDEINLPTGDGFETFSSD